MAAENADYDRYCPGEEHIRISEAICQGRRRANFKKCPGCQFNDDERGSASYTAQVVTERPQVHVPNQSEDLMIEKVFKAYDVRATVPDPLNEEVAWRIGNATAQFLRTSLSGYDRSDGDMNKLIIGHDMRSHSPMLTKAFIEGAVATGTPVLNIGMIDTSQIYFATKHLKCCGGVQVTASHNPENYNGFKICGPQGKPIGSDSGLKEIERIASKIARHDVDSMELVEERDLTEEYRAFVRGFLKPIRKTKMVVDASNGMAGRWFPRLFDNVDNLEVIALNFEHDGTFVHPPNPLVPANLEQLRNAVKEHGADIGACFDGDADRCMLVDENADIVTCDILTALLAADYLKDNPGSTIVYDLRSSRVVADQVKANGGTPKRQRVGHVFMKRAMAETNAVFGGELSGHFYFRDNAFCDSGMIALAAVLNVLSKTDQPLSALLNPLKKYYPSGELNFVNDDKEGTFKRIEEQFSDAEIDHLDGVTVQYEDWWFNVRASNTEPLLRLNMEANTPELLQSKLDALTPTLGEPAEEH